MRMRAAEDEARVQALARAAEENAAKAKLELEQRVAEERRLRDATEQRVAQLEAILEVEAAARHEHEAAFRQREEEQREMLEAAERVAHVREFPFWRNSSFNPLISFCVSDDFSESESEHR